MDLGYYASFVKSNYILYDSYDSWESKVCDYFTPSAIGLTYKVKILRLTPNVNIKIS